MKNSCIVVGAGMAGLTAANELTKKGWQVTVLDKGRGVGGRMATRRINEAKFDHGTQYFSTKSPDFQAFSKNLLHENIAAEWHLEALKDFSFPRIIGVNGMNNIPKYLAQNINVLTSEKVIKIAKNENTISVFTENGNIFSANSLIFTIPAPQAVDILKNSEVELPTNENNILTQILYQPCFAVMVVLNEKSNILPPGGIKFSEGAIAWIADNFQKGISPKFSATIHASPEFSSFYLEKDAKIVGKMLLNEAKSYILPNSIEEFQVHRWRYSLANERYSEKFLSVKSPFPMLFGGDGFGIGNVEGAFQSGLAMAQYLREK